MPYQSVQGTSSRYALVAFDAAGRERIDDPDGIGGVMSSRLDHQLRTEPITDVFIFAHGWHADLPAAVSQCDRWVASFSSQNDDHLLLSERRTDFRPLLIGVHWPSEPWGEEEFAQAHSFSPVSYHHLVESYYERLGQRPRLKESLQIVLEEAAADPDALALPKRAADAYRDINRMLSELGSAGESAAPGDDREAFDPNEVFLAFRREVSFAPNFFGSFFNAILAPLRQLSFWTMKQRARAVGESGMHDLLGGLQRACRGRHVRFHLSGHSFGAIVVSAMVAGPGAGRRSIEPVHSLLLLQGALSIWSYSESIPHLSGANGYFSKFSREKLVNGPIIATKSRFDNALGTFYPLGAGIARQIDFRVPLAPRYAALGAFGVQGTKDATDAEMLPSSDRYSFETFKFYNLDASNFIRNGGGFSGAHNDIYGPEAAHLSWQAAIPAKETSSFSGISFAAASKAAESTAVGIPFGVIPSTGETLPPISPDVFDEIRARVALSPDDERLAKRRAHNVTFYGARVGVDEEDLASSGWGIIFAANDPQATSIKNELAPLLEKRRQEAGIYFKIFEGETGYAPRETAGSWLARQGDGPSLHMKVDPSLGVPYYLLIVGPPEHIPFDFQYSLDMNFAVGRISFDEIGAYGRYARSVIDYEMNEPRHKRRIAVFAPEHYGDDATRLFHRNVATPLATGDPRKPAIGKDKNFNMTPLLGPNATKEKLRALLAGTDGGAPAVLFSGGHGLAFDRDPQFGLQDSFDDPNAASHQGGLLCNPWARGQPARPENVFTAADVPEEGRFHGMVHLMFACYGGGWGEFDSFRRGSNNERLGDGWPRVAARRIARRPAIAQLPQALLSHSNGGALCVIAHVDRVWSWSFQSLNNLHGSDNLYRNVPMQLTPFQDILDGIMLGWRIGHVMDYHNDIWSQVNSVLNDAIDEATRDPVLAQAEIERIGYLWIARDDARNYIVLGDPAVRLRVKDMPQH